VSERAAGTAWRVTDDEAPTLLLQVLRGARRAAVEGDPNLPDLIAACDGVTELLIATGAMLRDVPPSRLVEALRSLGGLPSDPDAGAFAARVGPLLGDAGLAPPALLAELALSHEPRTTSDLAASSSLLRREVEESLLRLHGARLVVWDARGARLLRPAAAVARHCQPVAAALVGSVERWVARVSESSGLAAPDESSSAWFGVLDVAERLSMPAALRWGAIRALHDLASTPERAAALDAVARLPHDGPSALLASRLLRGRGRLEDAARATEPWLVDAELGAAARLEHARTLYAQGRLAVAATMLDGLEGRLEPAIAVDALRTRAAIVLALDQAAQAREYALVALRQSRAAHLEIAEARCHGLLATIEHAELRYDTALEHALRARVRFSDLSAEVDAASARLTAAQTFTGQRRYAEALAELRTAREVFATHRQWALVASSEALMGLALLDAGDVAGALPSIETAAARVDERQPRIHAWISGIGAVAKALSGDAHGAGEVWTASAMVFGDMGDVRLARTFAAMARVVGAPVERFDLDAGPATSAETGELRREVSTEGGFADLPRGVWSRLAREVRRAYSGATAARDGSWFDVPGQGRVAFSRRPTLRRMVAALLETLRPDRPALRADDLFEAGWVGERALPHAARARVYVAISELRKAGLGPWIHRDGDGYRIVRVQVVD
jgi:tetratricopeptide (TPR) repeat protein